MDLHRLEFEARLGLQPAHLAQPDASNDTHGAVPPAQQQAKQEMQPQCQAENQRTMMDADAFAGLAAATITADEGAAFMASNARKRRAADSTPMQPAAKKRSGLKIASIRGAADFHGNQGMDDSQSAANADSMAVDCEQKGVQQRCVLRRKLYTINYEAMHQAFDR